MWWVALLLPACPAAPTDSVAPRDSDSGLDCPHTIDIPVSRTLPEPVAVPYRAGAFAVGDLAATGTPQVYVGTFGGVSRLDGPGWTTVTAVWDEPGLGGQAWPAVADLDGDGLDDLALGLPPSDDGAGQVVFVAGPTDGLLDWDSPQHQLKGQDQVGAAPQAVDVDGDGYRDLVVSGAASGVVRFGPIVDDDPLGGPADATIDGPVTAGDVDGDGAPDLVGVVTSTNGAWSGVYALSGPIEAGAWSFVDTRAVAFPNGTASPGKRPTLADADGDGIDEVYVAAAVAYFAYTMLRFPTPLGPVPETIDATALVAGAADLDGDGVADLVMAGESQTWDAADIDYGPIVAAPGANSCRLVADEAWHASEAWVSTERGWVGDLDGAGTADVLLGGLDADGQTGLVEVVLGGG